MAGLKKGRKNATNRRMGASSLQNYQLVDKL